MCAAPIQEVKVLLVLRDEEVSRLAQSILQTSYTTRLKLTKIELMQEAIEYLENDAHVFDFIIFEHSTPSQTLVKMFLGLGKSACFIFCSTEETFFAPFRTREPPPEFVLISDFENTFGHVLKKLATAGKAPEPQAEDASQYVPITPEVLLASGSTPSDVYVRLGKEQGRFVCLYKKGTPLVPADLKKYQTAKSIDFFYVKQADYDLAVKDHADRMQKLAAKPEVTTAEAKAQFSSSYDLIRQTISQVGFTPQAQMIAKSSVTMALKSLGKTPKLSSIIAELKKKEGSYISSHSFMVGQVACALAHKIGWSSAATLLKLSLSSFLHDISLTDDRLAEVTSYEEAKASGKFSDEEVARIRTHSAKSADYSKQFNEIPSDVDLIIAQHHELPNGKGFPREMPGKMISPLSAIFIMAHDMVHYFNDHPDATIESYFDSHAEQYQVGQFKKILVALKASDQVEA